MEAITVHAQGLGGVKSQQVHSCVPFEPNVLVRTLVQWLNDFNGVEKSL